jgi:hypothetical protein
MASNKRNLSLLAIVALLGAAGTAEAQAPLGTRAAGLAGAFVGVADDASAVYWNPAGLATGALVSAIITFSSEEIAPDDPQTAAGARHTGRMVALSLPPIGLAYYRVGAYGSEAATPAVIGPQSREEVRRRVHALTTSTMGVSLLQSLTEHIVVGVTPKVVRGSAARGMAGDERAADALQRAAALEGVSSTTFDVDAGVMIAVRRVRLGLVARNLTTPAFATATAGRPDEGGEIDEIELSREVRAGAAWGSTWPGHTRLMVAADADLVSRPTPLGDRRDVAVGVETWWMAQRVGVRGGLRRSTIGDSRAAATAGLSAAVRAGLLVEAHVVVGQRDERGWSIGARMGF